MTTIMYINNYLIHYGVPGMKWGVRKAKEEYRAASKNLQRAGKRAYGQERIDKFEKARKTRNDAYANLVVEKAKYNASKAKNASKAEYKTYYKSFKKHGLANSAKDRDGKSVALRERLTKEKGRKYTDKVLSNVTISSGIKSAVIGTAAATALGTILVHDILSKNKWVIK